MSSAETNETPYCDPLGDGRNGPPSSEPFVRAEVVLATTPFADGLAEKPRPEPPRRPRRKRLPALLFLLTALSTFWAGSSGWATHEYLVNWLQTGDAMPIRRVIVTHWQDGIVYTACVLAILLTHEMGHFLATIRHNIPASLPYFLPFPISPIGTMGAVIGMDGSRADRRQMFDVGIAGPLAGLVVAIPILCVGISRLDLTAPAHGPFRIDSPLAVRLLLEWIQPRGFQTGGAVWLSQLNPYFMAGWVGLVVTGLNMLPVSQLDGGHVVYTLFRRRARWIARGFMLVAVAYLASRVLGSGDGTWGLMILLVFLMGVDHPPTRDDAVPLGWFRFGLGLASLIIPVFCFPPRILELVGG